MSISFSDIRRGNSFSRKSLAKLWNYKSFHAIARGVVTPQNDNKIVLFVTEEKQPSAEQYQDRLSSDILDWEGPNDHFGQDRMVSASKNGDEIHLFYRERHRSDFMYCGRLAVISYSLHTDRPSHFKFKII